MLEGKNRIKRFEYKKDILNFKFSYNDKETGELNEILNNNAKINIDQIRRVALWKIDRVIDIPDNILDKIRSIVSTKTISLDSTEVKKLIEELISCQGIGMPMASAILKFYRPDVFPIIDVRAYRALRGKKIYYSQYNVDIYLKYANDLHDLASSLKRPLREMDEQLYMYDKEHNKKI
tara:strand:+ start:863 stop:1396 length:534 start_codon:yes stop_codon:yes gene_type:complete